MTPDEELKKAVAAHRDYMRMADVLTKPLLNIMNHYPPTLIIHADGPMETIDHPAVSMARQLTDEALRALARSYGFAALPERKKI